jgi:hypothetical protein
VRSACKADGESLSEKDEEGERGDNQLMSIPRPPKPTVSSWSDEIKPPPPPARGKLPASDGTKPNYHPIEVREMVLGLFIAFGFGASVGALYVLWMVK